MNLDGNWVDMFTFIAAILGAGIKPFLRYVKNLPPFFRHRDAANDAMNGATFFTFSLMIASVFSSTMMAALLNSTKVTIGLAGLLGCFYVIKELTSLSEEP
jgi:hypothetical protein